MQSVSCALKAVKLGKITGNSRASTSCCIYFSALVDAEKLNHSVTCPAFDFPKIPRIDFGLYTRCGTINARRNQPPSSEAKVS